jgi:small basic protein (TIGR04137 family)
VAKSLADPLGCSPQSLEDTVFGRRRLCSVMTIHSSLKLSSTTGGNRNVWTRAERLVVLKKAGKWKEGDRVEGLRKVRTSFKAKAKKKADAPAADATGAAPAAAAAAPGAAPAGKAPAGKAPAPPAAAPKDAAAKAPAAKK